MPDDSEDSALVAQVLGGHRESFAALVSKHRDGIRRLMRGYVRSEAEAEDLTQQAFTRALRSIASFRNESAFRTWLERIAINGALTGLRHARRFPSVSIEDVELITNALSTGRMASREIRRKLSDALTKLPPKQRLVVELRIVHEMSFRAIGEIAECSEDSAKANYQHAVKRLREWASPPEEK